MPRVTYLGADDVAREVTVLAGETLLDGALDNDIPGILGPCGGGCTCASGKRVFYAPGLGDWTPEVLAEADQADVVLIDGTLWKDDELADRGAADKTGQEMGHLAQSGDDGILARLSPLPGRKILIHINNTNPILDESSPERARLEAAGIEVAWDGMEIEF